MRRWGPWWAPGCCRRTSSWGPRSGVKNSWWFFLNSGHVLEIDPRQFGEPTVTYSATLFRSSPSSWWSMLRAPTSVIQAVRKASSCRRSSYQHRRAWGPCCLTLRILSLRANGLTDWWFQTYSFAFFSILQCVKMVQRDFNSIFLGMLKPSSSLQISFVQAPDASGLGARRHAAFKVLQDLYARFVTANSFSFLEHGV